MSRPGHCWRCGIDSWVQVDGRVWCVRCENVALSLLAALIGANVMSDVIDTIRVVAGDHLANEIARSLAPRTGRPT